MEQGILGGVVRFLPRPDAVLPQGLGETVLQPASTSEAPDAEVRPRSTCAQGCEKKKK